MRTKKWAKFFLITVAVCGTSVAQNSGSVRGSVVDENGVAVEGATVECDPADPRPWARDLQTVQTDKDGKFVANRLPLGSYKLFAMKESVGYPNLSFAFYSNHIFPTAALTEANPAAEVILKVGPSAGVITGTVRDAFTGNPTDAGFLLRRVSNVDNFISMSQRPEYRVLLPPDVEVLLEVSAPGHKTWYYGGPSDVLKRASIRLESGKVMKLDIQLEPEEKSESQH